MTNKKFWEWFDWLPHHTKMHNKPVELWREYQSGNDKISYSTVQSNLKTYRDKWHKLRNEIEVINK